MSRQRMIKPEFWSDESVNECSVSARLLFIASWNFADDEGNISRSAKQFKAQAFPYDKIDCEPLIIELITHGLLIEYSVSGKNYLHITNFKKHQIINRPSKPQCPLYEDSLRTHSEIKEIKEINIHKKRKSIKTTIPDDFVISESVSKWATENGHSHLDKRLAHFTNVCKAKAYEYADWDAAFRNAIVNDWAKIGNKPASNPNKNSWDL